MTEVVMIGGGVGAKSFAATAMALHPEIHVTMIRRNKRSPVPCGIPYALGSLKDPNDNLSPDKGLLDKGMTMIVGEVTGIDKDNKQVFVEGNAPIPYDKLVFATGSQPIVPPFPGKGLEGVHVIEKDLDTVVSLRECVAKAQNLVIVGGGFIGIELADEIKQLENKNITLVELAPHCLSVAFEREFTDKIEGLLKDHGIRVLTGTGVESFQGNEKGQLTSVTLNTGKVLPADMAFLAIGARPDVSLAKELGLTLDEKGAIQVDACQQTSLESIYAVGDCASKIDLYTGESSNIRLASVAAKEGRNAAFHILDTRKTLEPQGITNLFSTVVGGDYFGAAGMTKQQCEMAGFKVMEVHVSEFNRHPAVLPDSTKTNGYFLFNQEDLLLIGAQMEGNQQVAEMINALGIAIQNKATAYDLFAYNYGTHPMGTASPNKYLFHQAAVKALASKQ